MYAALQVVQIIISIALIILVVLQAKGLGLGGLLGSDTSGGGIAKTRRGLEKTLFQLTIALAAAFLTVGIVTVAFFSR